MFTLDDSLPTAADYLNHIRRVYPVKPIHQQTIALTQEVWRSWETQGTRAPDNLIEIASDPLKTYRLYCQDILNHCPSLQSQDFGFIHFALLPR